VELPWVVNRAQAGEPVYLLGDMNDHQGFAGPARRAGLVTAAGRGYRGIDWITGSPGVVFGPQVVDDSPLVDATSDHPYVQVEVPVTRVGS
jgi:hypothetical protein